jgi:Leucine-rich repeat (LRR) protein
MKLEQLQETQRKEKKAGDVVIRGKRIGDYETWDGILDLYLHYKLTSLEGCPKVVKGGFVCGGNRLISLKGAPEEVEGYFSCGKNKLSSLEFCPKKVGEYFVCNDNKITSLKGIQKEINGDFFCDNNQLTSLEYGPEKINGDCFYNINQITSLNGCPKEVVGVLDLSNNKLKDLHDIHKHIKSCGRIDVAKNPIKSHILGLLKIENLEKVFLDNKDVKEIINKYLPLGDIFACQSELIESGYEEFAKL